MIKYFFSDIDGTLIHSNGEIGMRTQRAIQTCGVPFSLVSARAPFEMRPLIQKLHLNGWQIAFNGALIFRNETVFGAHQLPASALSSILEAYRKRFVGDQVYCALYGANDWFAAAPDPSTVKQVALTGIVPIYQKLTSVKVPIFKVMFYCANPVTLRHLTAYFQHTISPDYHAARSGRYWLELTSSRANKASAIATVLAYHHILTEETVAFGDSENDLPMFREVGKAVAMGNAPEQIQRCSDFITTSNDEDGIAHFLEQMNQEESYG